MRDAGYRSSEEVDAWKARDPIKLLATHLREGNLASEADLTAIETEVRGIVEDAYEFARNSPYPDPATATEFVYAA
jgi:pyruvate dehydrogenase E1 component alpha subunit